MMSVATVVHRSLRTKGTKSPNTPNIIDTSISWNAEVGQSPKRRRSHQGPCSARKKLIPSSAEDTSLNLKLNNAEITLTPIRKTINTAEASCKNVVGIDETISTPKPNNPGNNESYQFGICRIVDVHNNARSTAKNDEVQNSKTKTKNVIPFVNSDEITIRPIAKKGVDRKEENVESSMLKSELSLTKPNCGDTSLEISGNVSDIMKMQIRSKRFTPKTPFTRNLTLKTTKCTRSDENNSTVSNTDLDNIQIAPKNFYKKSPDQRSTSTKELSTTKNVQNQAKISPCLERLEYATALLKNRQDKSANLTSQSLNNSPKLKPCDGIFNSTPKVAVITNPVVPNLQEICTSHNNFEATDIPEEELNLWDINMEDNIPMSQDSLKQSNGLETPDDIPMMASDIDLQEPYHMTGFPNPPGENRCWLNATLQALFAMPLLDSFHRYNLQECSKLTKYLITIKTHWMKGVSGREKTYQTVKLLKEELGILDETYPSERQQDVSEFLMILLNHIKSDLGKLILAEDDANEMENVPINQQDFHKVVKSPQTPNKRQPLADISTPKSNSLKRSHSLGDPNHSPRVKNYNLTHSVQDLLSPKLRKLSNPSDPSYKVHTPPLAPTNDEIITYKNPVDENFQLYLMEHYTCKGCQKQRQKKVDNLMLFVDIPSDNSLSPIDLRKSVENIFASEERSLTCGTCKHESHAMHTTFRRQPNILTLQVNRYGMSSEGIFSKISSDVKIPKNLDLSAIMQNASGGSTTYKPICIIAHAGGTMDCGHYTSYVRHGEQWYHYNDMNVAPMTEEEALAAAQMTAYLVFFVKSTSAEQDSDQVQ